MKKLRKILALLLVFVVVAGTAADYASAAPAKKAVKSVSITNVKDKQIVLKRNAKFTLKTKVVVSGNASKSVTYKSSNVKVATINKSGRIQALKNGTTTITVTSVADKSKKATIKVMVGTPVSKLSLNKTKATIYEDSKFTLKATLSPKKPTVSKVSYSSSNTKVATVNSKGVVVGKKAGTAKITVSATDGSNKKAVCTVVVKEKKAVKSVSITNVTTKQLVLKKNATYTLKSKVVVTGGASKKVSYTSSNKKVATVSSTGKIKALKNGTTTITVTSTYNKKMKATIKVIVGTPITKITLNKTSVSGYEGTKFVLTAKVSPSNASVSKLAYSTSNSKVATVDQKGNVTLKKAGTAKITVSATDGSNKKAVCTVVVNKKETPVSPTPSETPAPTDTAAPTESPTPTETAAPTETPTPTETAAPTETPVPTKTPELSYDGYELKWGDDFNGTELNTEDWNIEVRQPGWVNNELQSYTTSKDNIYLEDGNLVIKPIKTVDEDGQASYTSGRVNTQGKRDFTYGMFEAKVKVPAGQGFLPAFWLMASDENIYGQWPRCGEIDIMEVLGNKTDESHGTIHYGNPHKSSQGTYKLEEGNFVDEYHTFTCEWEPGKISWYVDGFLFHTVSDWYSVTEGQGEITYPAPFDQPFYMILNLAVGGNWPGNPDDSTDFDKAAYVIDSVKVYQKDSYNDNVEKPIKEVELRDPDLTGNYINNGTFNVAESLEDDVDWKFLTALGGVGSAEIADNELAITTTNAGTVDYSIQLVQPNLPMKKGGVYEVSFYAKASEARKMKVDISAPDNGYIRYFPDTEVNLSTEYQLYTYTFTMTQSDDANGRLEYNLGNMGSTGTVWIKDVKVKKTGETEIDDSKKVLADGNLVYNGAFQEGKDRLGFWDVTNECNATIGVTNINMVRRLKLDVPTDASLDQLIIGQKDLAFNTETMYLLSFDAEVDGDRDILIKVAGQEFTRTLTSGNKSYQIKFTTGADLTSKDFAIHLGNAGITYLDNIRIVEDSLIKNGSFNAGFAGFEVFVDGSLSGQVDYVVDSLNETNAADFTIRNTGDADWKIQLKQNNVELEQGQWYKLSLDMKSSIDRKVQFTLQRDGNKHANDWTPYAQDEVDVTGTWKNYEIVFQMKEPTDLGSIFNVAMGKVGGIQITEQHRVCIDNIVLEKTTEPPKEDLDIPYGENLLKNVEFANDGEGWVQAVTAPAAADVSYPDNKAVFNITSLGNEEWHIQLKQENIIIEQGESYKFTCKVTSSEDRNMKIAFLDSSYKSYGSADKIILTKDVEQLVTIEFTMNSPTDKKVTLVTTMGEMDEGVTPLSTITLSEYSLVKVAKPELNIPYGENLLKNVAFADNGQDWENAVTAPAEATVTFADNKAVYDITNFGTEEWHIQLKQNNIILEQGESYKFTCKVASSEARKMKIAFLNAKYESYGSKDNIELVKDVEQEIVIEFTMNSPTDQMVTLVTTMGEMDEGLNALSTITLSDYSLVKVAPPKLDIPYGENLLKNVEFADNAKDWENFIFADGGAAATTTFGDNKAVYDITSVGNEEWHIQLKQSNIILEQGESYRFTCKVASSEDRNMKIAFLDAKYNSYGSDDKIALVKDVEQEITIEFNMTSPTDQHVTMVTTMGEMDLGVTPTSIITLSDFSLVKLAK